MKKGRGEMESFEAEILLRVSDDDTEMILIKTGEVIIGTENEYFTEDEFRAWLENPFEAGESYPQAWQAWESEKRKPQRIS